MKFTPKQTEAIQKFRRHMESYTRSTVADANLPVITKFEITETTYGEFWITAELEMTHLPEGNLLRALSHEHWFVLVGKRGGIQVHSGPRSCKQFVGRHAFGMYFKSV